MKYVLVYWIVSNDTSILGEEFVKEKSMLEDPKKKGMVMFGDSRLKAPTTGWKSYLGRVLATSGSKKELMIKELDFLGNENEKSAADDDDDNDDDVHGAIRRRKRQRLDSDTQEKDKDDKKLSAGEAKKKAERIAYGNVFRGIASNIDGESDKTNEEERGDPGDKDFTDTTHLTKSSESFRRLEQEVSLLRKEITTLQKTIPDFIKDAVLSVLNKQHKESKKPFKQIPVSTSSRSSSPSTPSNSPKPWSLHSSTPSRSFTPVTPKTPTTEDNLCGKEELKTPNLLDYIDSVQMGEVMRSANYKKMTTNLMTSIFERKVLAESSVTGKSKEGRPALNRTKVELIIAFVMKKFPGMDDHFIKSTMAQKCKDLRFSMEGRRKKLENNVGDQSPKQ